MDERIILIGSALVLAGVVFGGWAYGMPPRRRRTSMMMATILIVVGVIVILFR